MLNGTHAATETSMASRHRPEEGDMPDAQRILDKLDTLQADIGSVAKEQARIQGAHDGLKVAVESVSRAIGDVSKVKVEAATMDVKLDNLGKRLESLERSLAAKDWRLWVERVVSSVLGGGSVAVILELLR